MSVEKNNLCPNCGAKLTGLEFKCPECGYVLTKETAAGQKTTDAILDLQEKLIAVDKVFGLGISSSRKKASIINSFPVPNTVESLTRLLHLSYSNFEASKESGDKRIAAAWLGKSVESYRRLSEMQGDTNISETLEKYKMLGDKNAFAKLTGSRAKKRWFALAGVAILASLVAFVLWFDWASLLIKNGQQEIAVHLLVLMGRSNQAIEELTKFGEIESAAELLTSKGDTLQAVTLLAKNKRIKDALILVGQCDSAKTIHSYIDEISKYCIIKSRRSYYYHMIGNDGTEYNLGRQYDKDTTMVHYYDSEVSLRRKYVYKRHKVGLEWLDYLEVMKDIDIPKPCEFVYPIFLNDYYDCTRVDRSRDTVSKVIRQADLITRIELAPYGVHKVFEFYYYPDYHTIQKERIVFKGTPTLEVTYDYGRGEYLSSVKTKYLLTKEEIAELFEEDDNVYDKWRTSTTHFDYSDGHLNQIRETLDYYDDFMYRVYSFEYYGNLRLRTITDIDYQTNKRTTQSEVNVEILLNGEYVESFVTVL